MNTASRFNFIGAVSALLFLGCVVDRGYAWHTNELLFGGTHRRITNDAFNNINQEMYPDLYRFAAQLKDGSNTEAHYPPGVPGEQQRWAPEPENWWDKSDGDKPCAVGQYKSYQFADAYTRIGYMLHLVQDREVPAHKYICLHGLPTLHSDELEDYALNHHDYRFGNTPWTFELPQGTQWSYWLDDMMDDDDGDGRADNDPLPGIPDYGLIFTTQWGLQNYVFGSYGYGGSILPFLSVRIPGKNNGEDYFEEVPNDTICYEQLGAALRQTILEMMHKSELLPPIIPADSPGYPSPSVSGGLGSTGGIFGPGLPVSISFWVMENRKITVKVSISADGSAIKDNSDNTWNLRDHDLGDQIGALPWNGIINVVWSGKLGSGNLSDGRHTISLQARDQDGHDSDPPRTLDVKYDGTAPTAAVSEVVD